MKVNITSWFLLLLCLPLLVQAGVRDKVRGTRYCEIIATEGWLRCAVYTTEGVNQCPHQFWREITPNIVKQATGASKVILHGPRYWVMDTIQTTPLIQVKHKQFKRLNTKKIAYIKIGLSDILKGERPYYRHRIDLNNTFIYKAGQPVYELIDPKGRIYVMQSYSLDKTKQSLHSLSELGTRLKLPHGWHFKTGRLREDKRLSTPGHQAVVLHDDFMNRYQLSAGDFLN